MSAESTGFDPYEAVLTDLRAKREQIDQTIQLLESLRGGASAGVPGLLTPPAIPSPGDAAEGPGAFLGMTIVDGAKKLLTARRRPLGNPEIVAALKAGGMALQSNDPVNTVGSVLTRRFNDKGDVVKVGRGMWGLPEWYPGRNFKKKAAKGEEAKNGTSEPEQPSVQLDDEPPV
jgi:hypothetical protein